MCIWVVHEYEGHGTISINRERGRGRGKGGEEGREGERRRRQTAGQTKRWEGSMDGVREGGRE